MELAKAPSSSAPPVPKPSVKRELMFDGFETPKKAKAPVPTTKKVVCAFIKTETLPTAAKSVNAPKMAPPVTVSKPAPPPKGPQPAPGSLPAPANPVVPSMSGTKVEGVVAAPVATPARAAPKAPTETHGETQHKAAALRRMKPIPTTPPPANKSVENEVNRLLANKARALTDEEMEEIQLENAILEELATKSDDELAAIMGEIQCHPFFPKFAQAQREETGLDDEWSFDVVEQIPMWEIWMSKQEGKASPPLSIEAPPPQTVEPKASGPGVLHITPPPRKHAPAERPVATKQIVTPKALHITPPPVKQPAVTQVATASAPHVTPKQPAAVTPKQPPAVIPVAKTSMQPPAAIPVAKTSMQPPAAIPVAKSSMQPPAVIPAAKASMQPPAVIPVAKTSAAPPVAAPPPSLSAFTIGVKAGSSVACFKFQKRNDSSGCETWLCYWSFVSRL